MGFDMRPEQFGAACHADSSGDVLFYNRRVYQQGGGVDLVFVVYIVTVCQLTFFFDLNIWKIAD